ncbi:MAG: glycoside hydrolase family 5 protein [Oscillospiraceae bacterium]|nr:glycoside hydrolase family 5 protein [Oscillospiraceae bacterium]
MKNIHKYLRRLLAFVIALTLMLIIISGCDSSDDQFKNITSPEMARLLGNGINLGNTMEACNANNRIPNLETDVYETMWGNPVTTQEMITGMKNAGFNTLRIPVAWTNAMDFEVGNFTINDAYLDRVEEIINYALNENMFVIVNNHWDHGWWSMFGHPDQAWRDFAREMFISMWTQIAQRYEKLDHRVIFEPSNEEWGNRFNDRTPFSPTGGVLTEDECYKLLTELSQVFVDLVRATGGNNTNRFLLMKGYNTDVRMTTDQRFKLPTDSANSRLLLSVHYYTPWSYCGDTSGVGAWGRTTEVEEMNELLGSLAKFVEMGYGVVLGEWGVLDNEGPDRLKFFTNFLDNSDLHGFAPILWDTGYDPQHGRLFDRNDTLTIVAPDILELFQSRSKAARADMSTEDIIAAAIESMAVTLQMAEERPETVLTADQAMAWIMFVAGGWGVQYSVGDRYQPESIAAGLVANDVEITGEGTYTVSLDFTGTSDGFADGFEFAAIGIMNGEILFPGYYINITELLINGVQAEYVGIPYTTNDNPVTTRVNLYNDWVNDVPPEARVWNADISEASPNFLENYRLASIETIEITFDYIAP